ncbi:MAG: alpha-1,4-glucan--maltose-1-phosphate maltosyltransferase [Planctomycetota bacterium]|nr:alpha-1,4-glucan--maltose-1-phosphate maltosyltransferase [Planctomycetaceae bacterium]MDQ3330182.1 alpha-1,4-glucan--maltose-1-phosphate maltosyltransferase [Planctomycetota bacterium]
MKSLSDHVPSRVIIEGVDPEIDGGRFPIKRAVGEDVEVEADIHTDGHEVLAATLKYRPEGTGEWSEVRMTPLGNDRWSASFPVHEQRWHEYALEAWIDTFATWRRDLQKKAEAQQDVTSELLEGAAFIRKTAKRAGDDGDWLRGHADIIDRGDQQLGVEAALDETLATVMARHGDRTFGHRYERVLRVWVDRVRARFASWYELFPRSTADEPGRHGTFRDVEKRLPYVAEMGFDILYLPPIHPIGRAFRKGPNNTLTPGPDDPGSPWAIGGAEGGHKAIHPDLGDFDDFDRLLESAKTHDLEIALDIAFQCSPDHPYVKEHPQWFKHRPDGTIKYAENPPKKYQDIYPLDFECEDWRALWEELLSVVMFWADRGVKVFRVDNPHTKPFRFWEWLIANVQKTHPDAIFLSEAFTRPKVMKYLAKSGFTQSYTYFTWRNTKWEIEDYFTELNQTSVREYMRPNLFANTPDILPEYLQTGDEAGFRIRYILAATLGATYGIYGPTYENFERAPIKAGAEEYLDSEKYQLRHWDWDRPNVFRELIALVNGIRKENPALQFDHRLRFYPTDNERIVCYGKTTPGYSNIIVTVVNVDPYHPQSGHIKLPLHVFGLNVDDAYQVQDLLTGAHFLWHGESNFVSLDPRGVPAHVLRLRKKARTERDFDYFM